MIGGRLTAIALEINNSHQAQSRACNEPGEIRVKLVKRSHGRG